MSEFDEWYEENSWDLENYYDAEKSFKAGQQSQQAKIDAITKQRDSFIKAHHIAMNDVCEHKAKIDELQARVDKVICILDKGICHVGYETLFNILTGEDQ